MKRPVGIFFYLALACLLSVFTEAAWAGDSSNAFMSATFGLSATRTQRRMEQSGAVALDFLRQGRLTMKGSFENRSAIFVFGFHNRRGLNHKAVYLASSGRAQEDRALYDGLRLAYNIRFGETTERTPVSLRARNRLTLRSLWQPNRDTNILLTYDPQNTNRFPGNSPLDRPIHLTYTYTRWTR